MVPKCCLASAIASNSKEPPPIVPICLIDVTNKVAPASLGAEPFTVPMVITATVVSSCKRDNKVPSQDFVCAFMSFVMTTLGRHLCDISQNFFCGGRGV